MDLPKNYVSDDVIKYILFDRFVEFTGGDYMGFTSDTLMHKIVEYCMTTRSKKLLKEGWLSQDFTAFYRKFMEYTVTRNMCLHVDESRDGVSTT